MRSFIKRIISDKNFSSSIRSLTGYSHKNIHLYHLAFLHSSLMEEEGHSNERLEYLGDAVLSLVVADYLFTKFPYKDEGYLTELRSKMVSRSQLNSIAFKMGIDAFIKYKKQDTRIGKTSICGNALESLIGAVYIDRGFTAAKNFIFKKIIAPFLNIEEVEIQEFNYKSKLIEWSQKQGMEIEFKILTNGVARNQLYKIAVMINETEQGTGEDFNKKNAEKKAAKNAFEKLRIGF